MRFPDYGVGTAPPSSDDVKAGLSVLVIGDLPEVVAALRRASNNPRMFVETAASPDGAVRLRQRFHFDLVITRFVDGADSASRWMADLRQPEDGAPVIVIADSLDGATALAAMRGGASDLL